MVALRTVRDEKVPQHENPAVIAFGTLVEALANDFGLSYRNVDNRVFEVTLPGAGSDVFGILTHADVVPAVADEWVLDDGTRLDPFRLTRVGDYLYGRGTIDDKGSIAAALYAMKTVKESGVPLARTIRLMIDTTEETGGDAMKYYRERTRAARVQHRARQQVPGRGGGEGLGRAEGLVPGASRRRHAARRSSR